VNFLTNNFEKGDGKMKKSGSGVSSSVKSFFISVLC